MLSSTVYLLLSGSLFIKFSHSLYNHPSYIQLCFEHRKTYESLSVYTFILIRYWTKQKKNNVIIKSPYLMSANAKSLIRKISSLVIIFPKSLIYLAQDFTVDLLTSLSNVY